MQTMNQSLYGLYQRKLITLEDAMGYSADPSELQAMLEGRAPVVQAGPTYTGGRNPSR